MKDLEKIGLKIKKTREDLGITQARFAMMVGTSETYLSEIESGKVNLTMQTLLKIIYGLDLSLEEFFQGL